MIAVDTCILDRLGVAVSRDQALSMLAALAKQTSHDLVLPGVVLDEYLAHRRIDLEESVRGMRKSIKEMMKRAPWWPGREAWADLIQPDVDMAVANISDELRRVFRQLPLEGGEAIEALQREAHRKPPANTGQVAGGARDAAAWISLVNWCKAHPDQHVYLVSDDGDFTDPLLDAERPGNLEVVKGIDAVLAKLATPHELPKPEPDLEIEPGDKIPPVVRMLLTSEAVTTAVSEAVSGVWPMTMLMYSTTDGFPKSVGWWGPGRIKLVEVLPGPANQQHAYEVNNQLWVTAKVRWNCELTFLIHGPERQQRTYTYDIDTTLVMRIGGDGDEPYATVAHTGTPTNVHVDPFRSPDPVD